MRWRLWLRPHGRATSGWLALIAAWLTATSWARPLMLPDEGRYAGVAWEMLSSGDWLTPRLDGLPFFHKPPLFYWLTAASMSLFGPNEWASRTASIVGATAAAFALFLFARRWFDEHVARATLLVLLTQPLFYIGAQFANLDMLVAGCISVTVLLLAHVVQSAVHDNIDRRALAAAYVFAALGVLAKGLIGVVLPALAMVFWLLAVRRWRVIFSLLWWPGVLLFLLVATPWFIAMQMRYPAFLDYFFVVQHFKRFAQGGFNNVEPFWFYPAALALLCLPWFLWLHRTCLHDYWRHPERGPVRVLMGLWLLVVVIFFSLPQSKLIGYVLPCVPPLSFLVADAALAGAKESHWGRSLWRASAGLALLLCIGTVTALSIYPRPSMKTMGRTLAAQQSTGEPVVFVNHYFYDLPFYARLRAPVPVVEAWGDPGIALHDNWRKELADAARFAPAQAAVVLLVPDRLPSLLCKSSVTWLVATRAAAAGLPFLSEARDMANTAQAVLWKVDLSLPSMTKALGCSGRPNGDSASR